ncbi:unnamed protein product [Rotaria sp. Silwood1]|nr:unnamed protein product [Rotaria sp. Silwood1]
MTEALLYDCACTLKLHWNNWLETDMLKLTDITRQLPKICETFGALDKHDENTDVESHGIEDYNELAIEE